MNEAASFAPMSVGQIVDRAFRIYKQYFVPFITIVALVQVPVALITIVVQSMFLGGVSSAMSNPEGGLPTGMLVGGGVGFVLAVVLYIVAQTLCNAALIRSVSETYLGKEVSVGEAYSAVTPKLGALIGASLLVGIVVLIGFILLVVPGVIFSLWFAFVAPVIVLEGAAATASMGRSRELARGNLGKIFLLGLVIGVITWVAGMLIGGIGGALATPLAGSNIMLSTALNQIFSSVAQILVAPLGACASILLYYDLRIRKEGFDLEMMAKSLGSQGT